MRLNIFHYRSWLEDCVTNCCIRPIKLHDLLHKFFLILNQIKNTFVSYACLAITYCFCQSIHIVIARTFVYTFWWLIIPATKKLAEYWRGDGAESKHYRIRHRSWFQRLESIRVKPRTLVKLSVLSLCLVFSCEIRYFFIDIRFNFNGIFLLTLA